MFDPALFGTYGTATFPDGTTGTNDPNSCLLDGVNAYPGYQAFGGKSRKFIGMSSCNNAQSCNCVRRSWTKNSLWSNVQVWNVINSAKSFSEFRGDDTGTSHYHPPG
jgi:hypothetical protein